MTDFVRKAVEATHAAARDMIRDTLPDTSGFASGGYVGRGGMDPGQIPVVLSPGRCYVGVDAGRDMGAALARLSSTGMEVVAIRLGQSGGQIADVLADLPPPNPAMEDLIHRMAASRERMFETAIQCLYGARPAVPDPVQAPTPRPSKRRRRRLRGRAKQSKR